MDNTLPEPVVIVGLLNQAISAANDFVTHINTIEADLKERNALLESHLQRCENTATSRDLWDYVDALITRGNSKTRSTTKRRNEAEGAY